MSRHFAVEVTCGREPSRMLLVGVLDLDTLAALDEAYAGAAARRGPQHVLIDVSGLKSCDEHGRLALDRFGAAGVQLHGSPPCAPRLLEAQWLPAAASSGGDRRSVSGPR